MNRIYLNFDKVHMTETVFLHTYVSSCFLLVSVWRYNEHVVNVRLCISTSESSKICMMDYQSRLFIMSGGSGNVFPFCCSNYNSLCTKSVIYKN